jgi:hypothetical protein
MSLIDSQEATGPPSSVCDPWVRVAIDLAGLSPGEAANERHGHCHSYRRAGEGLHA